MRIGKIKCIFNFFGIFYILQVATTQKLQRFTVNECVVICGVTAVLRYRVQTTILLSMYKYIRYIYFDSHCLEQKFIQPLTIVYWLCGPKILVTKSSRNNEMYKKYIPKLYINTYTTNQSIILEIVVCH